MSNTYPIVQVKPEWVVNSEDMGSKIKVWYRQSDNATKWLFKYPRPDTGEHWAEKIAAEVASVLGVKHAKVELAELQGERGSVTESFARGGRTLWHGNQLLEAIIVGYNPEKRFQQSHHTLENIWKVMENIFERHGDKKRAIAEYAVLDALIGNTDRHHENWGVLVQRKSGVWMGFVAPSFDHASSLGRELNDPRRNLLLKENRVGHYAEKGRGAIYWSGGEARAPSPLELARLAARNYPKFFRRIGERFANMDERCFERIINRIPSDWMSQSERMFALALMRYNYGNLLEVIP